jgi:hypothetical protein
MASLKNLPREDRMNIKNGHNIKFKLDFKREECDCFNYILPLTK